MDKQKQRAMLADIIEAPYAWPGGYAKFLIMRDGGVLCGECCKSQADNVREAIADGWPSEWIPAGIDAECNYDGPLDCAHCYAWIIEPEGCANDY